MMKKSLALACALSMALGMGTVAFASNDDTNIAMGKTPMASSDKVQTTSDGTVLSMDKALDGNTSTRWGVDGVTPDENGNFTTDVWFGVDLGAEGTFNKIVILWENARPEQSAEGYTLQYSNDNETWTDIDARFEYGAEKINDAYYTDTATFDSITARYVRVNMHKGAPLNDEFKGNPSIFEFEVYGTMNGAPATPDTDADTMIPIALATAALSLGTLMFTVRRSARKQ